MLGNLYLRVGFYVGLPVGEAHQSMVDWKSNFFRTLILLRIGGLHGPPIHIEVGPKSLPKSPQMDNTFL